MQGPRGVLPDRPSTKVVPLIPSDAFYPFQMEHQTDQQFVRSLLAVLFVIALPALVLAAAARPKAWRR
jgi:hypothetical protein